MNLSRQVFLLGAGGMGMAPLALYLRGRGVEVEAFDDSFREPVRSLLEQAGVRLLSEPVPSCRPAALVRSSAVDEDREAIATWRERGVPIFRRGEFLAKLLEGNRVVAVVGSHGKTTTAALLAWALKKFEFPCGYLVGGLFRPPAMPPAACVKDSPWVVVEVDESDGTIEDFSPEITVALNCDWDHADQYPTGEAFATALSRLFGRTSGTALVPEGDDRLLRSAREAGCPVTTFSAPSAPSAYNERNAAAAFAAVVAMGACDDETLEVTVCDTLLEDFPGLARRQVELAETADRLVLEDYAHHPAEIRAILAERRERWPNRRLRVIFQPHRYSRTRALAAEFAEELSAADDLLLLPTYGAFETPDEFGMAENVNALLPPRLRGNSIRDESFLAMREMWRFPPPEGDQVLFLGAGDLERSAHAFAAMERESDESWAAWASYLKPRLSASCVLRMEEPLADKTTLRVGGSARAYAEPARPEDLRELAEACSLFEFPFFVMGRGSNLIVPDDGFDGLVVRLTGSPWKEIEPAGEDGLLVGAGSRLKEICRVACEHGLVGFEFLEGIPGTLGGALRMNAGAMGEETESLVESVTFLMPDGRLLAVERSALDFGYRSCSEAEKGIAIRARLRGAGRADKTAVRRRIDDFARLRRSSQPRERSAGCIFRNPSGDSAGRLIDHSGLKGESFGGATVSNVHANFIVNNGSATAEEVITLIRHVRERVREDSGVRLEPEVTLMGKSWEDALN